MLVAILFRLNFSETIESIADAKIIPLIFAYLTSLPAVLIRSLRWRLLLLSQGIRLSYWESITVYAFSIFLGTLTPGRLGEFSKSLYLKQKGISWGASFFSVIFDRALDVVILIGFAFWALYYFDLHDKHSWLLFAVILSGSIVISAVFWWFKRRNVLRDLMRFLVVITPKRFENSVLKEVQDFCEGVLKIKWFKGCCAIGLSIFAWIVNFYGIFLCGKALGFPVSLVQMAFIAAICALVALLPISVMGIGTRDAVLIFMLGKYGITEGSAVAFSSLILSIIFFNGLICSLTLFTPAAKITWRLRGRQTRI
jgi:glycosyltransferase 2 family protein